MCLCSCSQSSHDGQIDKIWAAALCLLYYLLCSRHTKRPKIIYRTLDNNRWWYTIVIISLSHLTGFLLPNEYRLNSVVFRITSFNVISCIYCGYCSVIVALKLYSYFQQQNRPMHSPIPCAQPLLLLVSPLKPKMSPDLSASAKSLFHT